MGTGATNEGSRSEGEALGAPLPQRVGAVTAAFVRALEQVAMSEWKATADGAAQFGVTNEYVKRARDNLAKYAPGKPADVKDSRP